MLMAGPVVPPSLIGCPPVSEQRKFRRVVRLVAVLAVVSVPSMALAAPGAPPDPVNAWQYPHWPQKQPWQESGPDTRVAKTLSSGLPGPIDPQNWENPDHMTWDDYVKPPGTNWADPGGEGIPADLQGRAGAARLPEPGLRRHQAQGVDRLRQPECRGERRTAGSDRAVLQELPQHPRAAEPRSHAARVLDGGLRRPVRRRPHRVRPVPDAGQVARVRDGVPERRGLPGR